MSELEALKEAEDLREQELSGRRSDLPGLLRQYRDAPAYYGVLREVLDAGRLSEELQAEMAIRIEELIEARKITDWVNNLDLRKQMENDLDDYLYQVEEKQGIRFSDVELDDIISQVIDIARKRA